MLLMDPAFNEANFGYVQFKAWLEDNGDLVRLYVKDLQLYVAQADFIAPGDLELLPASVEAAAQAPETPLNSRPTLDVLYRQIFNRLKMASIDLATRRDVLRDIYRELCEKPGMQTTDELLEDLRERYEAQGLLRSKAMLREILQMANRQQALDYRNQPVSLYSPVWLAAGIDSEAAFVRHAESDFVYAVVRAGLEIDMPELAYILLNDRNQVDYIQSLFEDLKQRSLIVKKGKRYALSGNGMIPFAGYPALQILCQDIEQVQVPENIAGGVETAHSFSKKAMVQRSQDFAASANTYLLACKLQWDAVEKNEQGATLEDLRWFMASYASAIAGKLSQVNRDYRAARPYYLAFFALVQEDDPLWSRMRGLINPMLAYYWANAGRELEIKRVFLEFKYELAGSDRHLCCLPPEP